MSLFAPLLAAGDAELIKVVIIVVFGILVGIGKFVAMLQKNKPPAPMGQRPAPPPPANAGDEIEAFLRRAATKPRTAAKAAPVRRPPQPQPRPAVEKPVQAQVVSNEPVGARIAKEVDRDLDTQEFTSRTTQLGSEVTAADRQIDEHLHQVFDHHVSDLELLPGEAAAAGPSETPQPSIGIAIELTDLLANPASVRQAIVLNEILRRPEERW
jgi:hypothetical protein